MGGLTGAWLAALGIITWRQVQGDKAAGVPGHMPVPGTLLAVTGLFTALSIAASTFPAARRVIIVTAVGLDVAGALSIWQQGLGGQAATAAASTSGGTAAGGGTQTA